MTSCHKCAWSLLIGLILVVLIVTLASLPIRQSASCWNLWRRDLHWNRHPFRFAKSVPAHRLD
jgi:hypothetical protein